MRRAVAAAAAIAVAWALAATPAAAMDADGLKAEVEAMLAEARALVAPATIQIGPVEVVPDGAGFRVTLPDISIDDPVKQQHVAIGTLAATVSEPGPGLFGIDDVSIPERMTVTENGQETGWLALDLDRYSGVYSTGVHDFMQLDLLINSFELRIPEEAVLIGGGRTTAWIATVPEHDASGGLTGYQRQQQYGSVQNMVITSKDAVVEIDQLTVDGASEGLDLAVYENLVAIFDDLELAGAQQDTARLEVLRKSLSEAVDLAETMRAGVQILGLRSFDETGGSTFALDSLRLGFDIDMPRGEDFAAATLALSGEGLSLDAGSNPEIQPYVDLIPHSWNIPLKVDHLPTEALALAMADVVYQASGNALTMPEEQLNTLGQAIMGALGTAGSYFIVRDLFLESPLVRLDSKASLAFSPNAQLGVVGNWAVTLTGLDRVLALAEGMSDPDAKRMLSGAVLAMMGVGQATALPDGRVGYRFSFSFAPDGTVQMNGFSFGDFLNKAIPQ